MARSPAHPNLVMIGFMGVGKTSVGRLVAQTLGREFLDTDEMVERRARASVGEVFRRDGETVFRQLEADAIKEAVAYPARVVTVGGGAPLSVENRTLLKQTGFLVYLRAKPETLVKRLTHVHDRPLLAGADRLSRVRDLLSARDPVYETAGDALVDTDGITAQETAEQVVRWYRERVGLVGLT